ncbi:uncharacterized protein [Parasteatoda tepidariorum]|uniref:uncharacterized protein n=1 Tax=Parasteatoda tepidariorum TaxID=114398 RepID=UPI0039BD4792
MKELALEDAEGYRRFLRMDTEIFEILLQKVEPLIVKQSTVMSIAIPAAERLAITLRYLTTGETQSSIAFNSCVAQNTISGIIPTVCTAITDVLKDDYMKVPTCEDEWKKIAADFRTLWNFPLCIGALDGKHINIAPPPNSGSSYWNYKQFFSVVLLALVDANLMFIYVDVGTNGRISDGGVWNKSTLKKLLDSGKLEIPKAELLPELNVFVPHVIVADDAFPLEINIMKPYPGKYLSVERRVFNYRLSRARRVVENAFGILATRFRVFQTKIQAHPIKVVKIVLAACALHNFLRYRCKNLYTPSTSLDREDLKNLQYYPSSGRSNKTLFKNFRRNQSNGNS